MANMTNQDYLKVAISAAKQSGAIFKKYFGNAGKVSIKNGDPRNQVTKIDLKIEQLIRRNIISAFPVSKIIGEEYGSSKLKPNDIVWLIDPIDGTTNYIRGIPITCISIGVWDKNGPVVGVVYNPLLEQIYSAIRGKGAFLNGKKIKVSGISKINLASGAMGWQNPNNGKQLFNKLITVCKKMRVLASSTWQTCLVASGQLDFYVTNDVHIWDVGAAMAILKEAGGAFTSIKGQALSLELSNIVASNGKIHSQLLKIVR
jgi:myo-inositol-1(or 4)-monophosphatase